MLFRSARPLQELCPPYNRCLLFCSRRFSLSSSLHFNVSSIILCLSHTNLSGPSHFSFCLLHQFQSFRSHRCSMHSINLLLSVPATPWVLTYFLPLFNSDSTNPLPGGLTPYPAASNRAQCALLMGGCGTVVGLGETQQTLEHEFCGACGQ